jgi:hypothetical protein
MAAADSIPFSVEFSFRDGKLFCSFSDRVEVIRPWGTRAGAWQLACQRWRNFLPQLNLRQALRRSHELAGSQRPGDRSERDAWDALLASIPACALDLLLAFPGPHWRLTRLLDRGGTGMEQLAQSVPALAAGLAGAADLGRRLTVRERLALLRQRRRDLAAALGFPARESAVRFLAKLPARACHTARIARLRDALGDPQFLARTGHLAFLSGPLLDLLLDQPLVEMVEFPLLDQLATAPPGEIRAVVDCLRDLRAFREQRANRPARIRSREHLQQEVRRLRLAAERDAQNGNLEFPPPPFQGLDWIEPIRTPEALTAEGRAMHHCAASYARSVASGQLYFYRVLAPERATLAINLRLGRWTIHQIQGPCNRPVPRAAAAVGHLLQYQLPPAGPPREPAPRIIPAPIREAPPRPRWPVRRPNPRQLTFDFS